MSLNKFKKIKRENYITIQGFMVLDLGLSGNELLAYALIYGFCQLESSEYNGSISYLCDWLNISRSTAIRTLQILTEKQLIQKRSYDLNNVTFNKYTINYSKIIESKKGSVKMKPVLSDEEKDVVSDCKEVVSKCDWGSVKMKPNSNNDNDIKDKEDIYIPPPPPSFSETLQQKKPLTQVEVLNAIEKKDIDICLVEFFNDNKHKSNVNNILIKYKHLGVDEISLQYIAVAFGAWVKTVEDGRKTMDDFKRHFANFLNKKLLGQKEAKDLINEGLRIYKNNQNNK